GPLQFQAQHALGGQPAGVAWLVTRVGRRGAPAVPVGGAGETQSGRRGGAAAGGASGWRGSHGPPGEKRGDGTALGRGEFSAVAKHGAGGERRENHLGCEFAQRLAIGGAGTGGRLQVA